MKEDEILKVLRIILLLTEEKDDGNVSPPFTFSGWSNQVYTGSISSSCFFFFFFSYKALPSAFTVVEIGTSETGSNGNWVTVVVSLPEGRK